MNIYRRAFIAVCPNNGQSIDYALVIETNDVIPVEDIVAITTAQRATRLYHEHIADELFERLGGRQTITAHHHGVDIETRRGFSAADDGRLTQRVQVGATVFEKGTQAALAREAIGAR